MKLYKLLPLFLLSSFAYAESDKDLVTKMCHDNAMKIVNKDFDSYIEDFHPKVQAVNKANSYSYMKKKFLKKASRYDDSIKTADYERTLFILIEEKDKDFLFNIEKKVQVEIGFLNIETGSSHFLCDYGLDKETNQWYKTSL